MQRVLDLKGWNRKTDGHWRTVGYDRTLLGKRFELKVDWQAQPRRTLLLIDGQHVATFKHTLAARRMLALVPLSLLTQMI